MQQDLLVEYWEKLNLLEGAKDKKKLANILENQKTANTFVHDKLKDDDRINLNLFKNFTIALIKRLCVDFPLFDMINFDVVAKPVQNISYKEAKTNSTKEIEIVAKTRFWKTRWNQGRLNELYDTELTKLDAEAKFFMEFYDSIYNEMEAEIVGDLSRNVGSFLEIEWKNIGNLLDNILIRSRSLEKESGRSAEWIIIPVEIYNEIKTIPDYFNFENLVESSKIQKVGQLFNSLDVYVYPELPDLEILIGNTNYGYFYCPYIPFTLIEGLPDVNWYGLLMRYGKKLVDNSHYSKIIISGYSFKKE
jgi:hypothetical protein